ncbi:hypothetical protein Mth01_06140 [Sphaerimonospora thailandensis]|uniref:Uncharacterized protein n=1 Tax=Sphaerimonospora thailandensis TaxID=795644 RepID=A0A8J3R5T1_9ACTN|nr:hypothetical protein Mth01_06140 [Sphaerimonospora thailandensis]
MPPYGDHGNDAERLAKTEAQEGYDLDLVIHADQIELVRTALSDAGSIRCCEIDFPRPWHSLIPWAARPIYTPPR